VIVWPCPLDVSAYAAIGRRVDPPGGALPGVARIISARQPDRDDEGTDQQVDERPHQPIVPG
jgi:hypothetical protein